MKLEIGKTYKTGDGKIALVLQITGDGKYKVKISTILNKTYAYWLYTLEGKWCRTDYSYEHVFDLVEIKYKRYK